MNVLDILLLVLAGMLVVVGAIKGMTRILVGIAGLIAAFVVAARFHPALASRFGRLGAPPELTRLAAYLALFVGVMLAFALLGFLIRKLLQAAMLSWADRLGGAALGLVAAALLAALLTLPVVAYSSGRVLYGSSLAPYVTVVADVVCLAAPADLSQRYRRRVEDVRRHWREP